MDPSMEIRKLPISAVRHLASILDYRNAWKEVMANIPATLSNTSFECNLENQKPKYNSDHTRLIESASLKTGRDCTEILLDEWGTSGRIRPKLGHLLHLLVKTEEFRAADYVAVNLLNQKPPKRPKDGPAAPITTLIPTMNVEDVLNQMEYPSSLISDVDKSNIERKNFNDELQEMSYGSSLYENINYDSFDTNIDRKSRYRPQFSNTSNKVKEFIVPKIIISDLTKQPIPPISQLMKSDSTTTTNSLSSESISNILPKTLNSESDNNNSNQIPNLSILNIAEAEPASDNLPCLSALMQQDFSIENNNSKTSTDKNWSRSSCVSPLPNLTLNTILRHFTYTELEAATNGFDATPHDNASESETSGRFLGSGAFGSVYLALNLLDRPVAVKRLRLDDDVEVVTLDDAVTKQFRNEVEVLCRYEHENLLSLLGYSCDGPTYCLMYEYISGGPLSDRLQNKNHALCWEDRIKIAVGTASGISYLHTAFTPLIHRDIKSANILLDCSNKPKLGDFGLIKLTSNTQTNLVSTVFGTSAYMAPEAFRGDVSTKMDTFSFGVVLLELLTALPPLDADREGCDLVTFIQEREDEELPKVFDDEAGDWTKGDVNFAQELYKIANNCLMQEKKKRPEMIDVYQNLLELLEKIS